MGNTRLKWGRLDESGRIVGVIALPLDDPAAWSSTGADWNRLEPRVTRMVRAVSTVNPPVADRLEAFFHAEGIRRVTWIRSAARRYPWPRMWRGPIPRRISDRAPGGLRREPSRGGGPAWGWSSCAEPRLPWSGSTTAGSWQERKRSAAPGAGPDGPEPSTLMTGTTPIHPPGPHPSRLGAGGHNSLSEARHFLGIVGAVPASCWPASRDDLEGDPWVVWTGGDSAAPRRPHVSGTRRSDRGQRLILLGIAEVAFGSSIESIAEPGELTFLDRLPFATIPATTSVWGIFHIPC